MWTYVKLHKSTFLCTGWIVFILLNLNLSVSSWVLTLSGLGWSDISKEIPEYFVNEKSIFEY